MAKRVSLLGDGLVGQTSYGRLTARELGRYENLADGATTSATSPLPTSTFTAEFDPTEKVFSRTPSSEDVQTTWDIATKRPRRDSSLAEIQGKLATIPTNLPKCPSGKFIPFDDLPKT